MRRVVIIGGGVMGSSIAYHLTRHPGFDGSVVVIERDPAYTRASSALSCSSIRVQFSTPVNIALSQFGLGFIKAAAEALAVGDDRPALGLREPGYLYAVPDHGLDVLREVHAAQVAAGADVALLDPDALAARFPWLCTDGVAMGSLGLSGEGWFNGPGLHMAMRAKAIAQGAMFLHGEATGFQRARDHIYAVTLASGAHVPADIVVNAAGAWSWQVASWVGIDLPIRPRARMVFTFACRAALPEFPLLIDPSGIWARPEGNLYLSGFSPHDGEPDPDEAPLEIDEAVFHDRMWPVLAARVPAFEALRLTGGWAGYYEYNTVDQNGVVGAWPDRPELIHCAGFSGHGMQHSPGIGRGVAELIADGSYQSLDLSPLSPLRLIAGRPLLERCVI